MGTRFLCKKKPHKKMSSSSSSTDVHKHNKKNRHCYTFENDEYSVERLFEAGSVVHNREWCYNVVDQAAAVEVAVLFKARCTFSVNGEGYCRVLKIVDDTGYVHGELELFIKPGKASVKATPVQMKIQKKERTVRPPQPLKTDCHSTESSDYTEVRAEETFRVRRSDKLAAQQKLKQETAQAKDEAKSKFGIS